MIVPATIIHWMLPQEARSNWKPVLRSPTNHPNDAYRSRSGANHGRHSKIIVHARRCPVKSQPRCDQYLDQARSPKRWIKPKGTVAQAKSSNTILRPRTHRQEQSSVPTNGKDQAVAATDWPCEKPPTATRLHLLVISAYASRCCAGVIKIALGQSLLTNIIRWQLRRRMHHSTQLCNQRFQNIREQSTARMSPLNRHLEPVAFESV